MTKDRADRFITKIYRGAVEGDPAALLALEMLPAGQPATVSMSALKTARHAPGLYDAEAFARDLALSGSYLARERRQP